MAEKITINTYELGEINGELIKETEDLLIIKTEDYEYLKVIK